MSPTIHPASHPCESSSERLLADKEVKLERPLLLPTDQETRENEIRLGRPHKSSTGSRGARNGRTMVQLGFRLLVYFIAYETGRTDIQFCRYSEALTVIRPPDQGKKFATSTRQSRVELKSIYFRHVGTAKEEEEEHSQIYASNTQPASDRLPNSLLLLLLNSRSAENSRRTHTHAVNKARTRTASPMILLLLLISRHSLTMIVSGWMPGWWW